MQLVLLTALGVGGATVIGALLGFIFKKISHTFSDVVLALAAGVMLAAAVIGLIPNCAASVAIATLWTHGVISGGAMLAGLLTGAGAGLLVLFRTNKKWKENLLIVGILLLTGVVFGSLLDLTGLGAALGL